MAYRIVLLVLTLSVLWLMASVVLMAWVNHGAKKKRKEREAE